MSRLYLSNPCALLLYPLHTAMRAQSAPGFPCALCSKRANDLQTSGENAPRECILLFDESYPQDHRRPGQAKRGPGLTFTELVCEGHGSRVPNNRALWIWIAFAGSLGRD